MNEENAQAQNKFYNKIRSMPSKSSAATWSMVPSVNKMWYSRIWVLKYTFFPSNQPFSNARSKIITVTRAK